MELDHEIMKTWKYTFILLLYLYNSMSLWLNISCLQTVRGGRHLKLNLTGLQNLHGTRSWNHENMKIYFYTFTLPDNSMSLYLHMLWNKLLHNVLQIKSKFKLVIQGASKWGTTWYNAKMSKFFIYILIHLEKKMFRVVFCDM